MEESERVCLAGVGDRHLCYLHKCESEPSKGWRTLFWHIEIPRSTGSSQQFPKLSCSYRPVPLLLMLRTYYFFTNILQKRFCFSAPRRTSKAMVSDTVPWHRKSAFTLGLERGRPRTWATSFMRVSKLGSYWSFQNRPFSFSRSLVWLLVRGIISVSSFWGITSNFVSWLCETERVWNLTMYHKIELNNYFLTSTC